MQAPTGNVVFPVSFISGSAAAFIYLNLDRLSSSCQVLVVNDVLQNQAA